jgi:hypothetical protein
MLWLEPKSIEAHSVADEDECAIEDQPLRPFTPPSTFPSVMKLGSHPTPSPSVELTDTDAPSARLLFTVVDRYTAGDPHVVHPQTSLPVVRNWTVTVEPDHRVTSTIIGTQRFHTQQFLLKRKY